jgi:hypothetical protein
LEKLLAALAVLPFGVGIAVSADAPADDVAFSFADPEIIESSGLAVADGLFATVNDSGDTGRVFTVDPADGRTVAETTWDAEPTDVEAMAVLPGGDLLVGDIGDNTASRESIELLRVPFGEDGRVDPTVYGLAFADGPHDAEALLVHPRSGQVLVVAKEFIGRLYAAPPELAEDGTNELELIGEDVLPIVTDGAFFPDGKHFVLRGYGDAAFYRWPSLEPVGEIQLPAQEQGEGIAVARDGSVYVSSEGINSEVLEIRLPRALRAEIEGTDQQPDDGAPPDDGAAPPAGPATDSEGEDADQWHDILLSPWVLGGTALLVGVLVLLRLTRPRSVRGSSD